MMHLDAWELTRMAGELSMGITIKLFCDNGRVHWRDLVNDLFFWVPGVTARKCDGLSVQLEGETPVFVPQRQPQPLAAK